jgi:hypothetical protein
MAHSLAGVPTFAGACIGLVVALLSAWGDFEGLSYFATGASYEAFSGLNCPVVLSRAETGKVSAVFDNRQNTAIEPYYRVEVCGPVSSRRLEGQVRLPPGTSRQISWTIGPADIDLGSFILVKLDVLPVAGHQTREATCGVIVLPLGRMSGRLALNLAICAFALLTIVGMLTPALVVGGHQAGLLSRGSSSRPPRLQQTLGIFTSLAILAGLAGLWTAALVLCGIGFLLLLIPARAVLPA